MDWLRTCHGWPGARREAGSSLVRRGGSVLWLESPAPAGRKQVESKGVLRLARTANGNGDAAGSSSFLFALPRLTSAAFMRNRLRQTHPAVGTLGPERLSLPAAVSVSKGPGTGGRNVDLARSIRGARQARCSRTGVPQSAR